VVFCGFTTRLLFRTKKNVLLVHCLRRINFWILSKSSSNPAPIYPCSNAPIAPNGQTCFFALNVAHTPNSLCTCVVRAPVCCLSFVGRDTGSLLVAYILVAALGTERTNEEPLVLFTMGSVTATIASEEYGTVLNQERAIRPTSFFVSAADNRTRGDVVQFPCRFQDRLYNARGTWLMLPIKRLAALPARLRKF
jgi:hypothetical protein